MEFFPHHLVKLKLKYLFFLDRRHVSNMDSTFHLNMMTHDSIWIIFILFEKFLCSENAQWDSIYNILKKRIGH